MKTTQCESVQLWLNNGGTITPLEAYNKWGIMRLARVIGDLRKGGMDIDSTMVGVKNRNDEKCRVAQYSLAAPTHEGNQAVFRGIML